MDPVCALIERSRVGGPGPPGVLHVDSVAMRDAMRYSPSGNGSPTSPHSIEGVTSFPTPSSSFSRCVCSAEVGATREAMVAALRCDPVRVDGSQQNLVVST